MGLLIPYYEPQLGATNSQIQPNPALVYPVQGGAWQRGDILYLDTVGTIVSPPGNGSGALAGVAGPATSAITITNYASSGAPALSYYIIASYTGSSAESQSSAEILYNCPAGYVPAVNVSATGAPGSATGFAVYAGLFPGSEVQQITGGTLGTASDLAYPLTNNRGANKIATNPAGSILGIAQSESTKTFGPYPGGSHLDPRNAFGVTADFPPLSPSELSQLYVITLNDQPLEMSLNQSYALNQSLIGTTVGIAVDSTTGFCIADPSQTNKIATIIGIPSLVPALVISNATASSGNALGPGPTGQPGDLGGRVTVMFNSADLTLLG